MGSGCYGKIQSTKDIIVSMPRRCCTVLLQSRRTIARIWNTDIYEMWSFKMDGGVYASIFGASHRLKTQLYITYRAYELKI